MIKRAPLEIPPAVARQFIADMQAYYAEDDAVKRDEIANRQLHALRCETNWSGSGRDHPVRLKALFEQLKDHLRRKAATASAAMVAKRPLEHGIEQMRDWRKQKGPPIDVINGP